MNCENLLSLFDDRIDGELDETTAITANTHLFSCPACSAEVEMLRSEREMYSHFLFDIEPPSGTTARFAARLAEEKAPRPTFVFPSTVLASFVSAFRLTPVMALSAVVLVLGVGLVWIHFSRNQAVPNGESSAKRDVTEIKADRNPEVLPTAKPADISAKPIQVTVQKQEGEKKIVPHNALLIRSVVPRKLSTQTVRAELTDADKLQIQQMRSIDIETAKQIEKVELLLRSFRNASYIDGGKEFDLAYETEQARRLLTRNFELRQKAAGHGSAYAGEMLSRVEPYLLEIAHLDKNPSSTAVAEIKDRVKNQRIIASLQGF